jgi:apolipoprotein N-acyltransferase
VKSRNLIFAIAAGIATALLSYFGTGLHPIWSLLWFAPVPVLALAPRLRASRTFLLAFFAWLIGETNLWNFYRHAIELPLALIIVAFALPAGVFGLAVLLTRRFVKIQSLFPAALALPVVWVTYEYLTAISSPHSTSGNVAYSQMNCLPLIQLASITGIWGISFIVFLFAGTIATLLSGAGSLQQRRGLAVATGIVICAVFLFGEWRLRAKPADSSVAVTLVAKDVPMSTYLGSEEQALTLLREYADEVRRVTPPGTELVILPEKIARLNENSLSIVDSLFSATAAATGAVVDLGVVRKGASDAFNSSRVYSPDGTLQANYDKHHLIPGIEPEKSGTKRVVLDQPSGRWGLQICKDMDFPRLSREYARDGANLLVVPAWDFDLDRWVHSRMAILRGVENGFAIGRAARNGLLTLSDNRGRILAERATIPGQFVSLNGRINVVREQTFYARTGDWFAWLCLAGFLVLLVVPPRTLPTTRN